MNSDGSKSKGSPQIPFDEIILGKTKGMEHS